uniref:HECT-type E3 ubiquitin transferase n=1 Tax=Kwoniella pini CBS 10737 TaxID=1296096 RepID=A0A1B9I159_9TREE|nr:uncharacterized protein I206_04933 [Kwoniella pini CBS 10737]OCF49245.1 hypothetical protein I206_04933 [Kwoniella pini CBS 10737]
MKVKKSTRKHGQPPPDVLALALSIAKAPQDDLLPILQQFDSWKYPRGDLHTWVDVLDKFDDILAEITKSYDLHKIQVNDFTPKTRELVLEILRVQRLLLENCTSRKLFASYDRLADLLHTSDLDILYSAIFVILRPAQQYANSTPFEPTHRHAILHRLLTLSRSWERFTNADIPLPTLASSSTLSLPEDLRTVQLQYYPTKSTNHATDSPVKASSSQETPFRPRNAVPTTPVADLARSRPLNSAGPSVLDLGNVDDWTNPIDQLSLLCDESDVSLDDQYAALNKVRLARLGDLATRRQLLGIRLMALATYVYVSTDDAAQSGLFLYEPELVPQLADLLRASQQVGETVTIGVLHALDACAHHRVKMSEVLTAVSANVNHGILVTFFRNMVEQLMKGESVPNDLFDAAISFVAYIPNSPVHINMLMGAGILRLLLEVLGTTGERRENYIPRATGLIDSIIFASPQALSNFSNADGVNLLVHRIKAEIEGRDRMILPHSSETLSEDTILAYMDNPLKSVLRSIHRLMQASGGTEGLRNLVDSDLPKCLKSIFEQPAKFGTRVYGMAINIMSTFVHNEPTSLSILQELQLPQALFAQLEKGIPPSSEVIGAVPTAIGAICLNQAGLDFTLAHPSVINNLVAIVNLPSHENVFHDRDNGKSLGGALDELSRHQPALRPLIMKAMLDLLRQATEAGAEFAPSTEDRREYFIDEMDEVEVNDTRPPPSNPPLVAFSRIFRVLDGLVRNAGTAKEFIKDGGLKYVLGLAELPCLPIRFGSTEAAAALSSLLRHVGEHDQAQLVEIIRTSIQAAMGKCDIVWKGDHVAENWIGMDNRNTTPEVQQSFKVLRSLGFRLSFLSDVIFTLSFTNSRHATSIITALEVDGNSSFVNNLGQLHRVAFQQHVLLKKAKITPADELDPTRSQNLASDSAKDTGAKYLATRLHAVLTKFFKTIIKLIHVKRNPDVAHVNQARNLSNAIANIMIEHLSDNSNLSVNPTGIDTVALGVVTMLLFENGRGTDGPLHTTLFLDFLKKDGLARLVTSTTRITDRMAELAALPEENRDQSHKDALVEATAGIKIVLVLLSALASPRSLLETPETHALQQRPQAPLVAVKIFIKLRLAMFPLVHYIWNASWLLECPISIVKIAVRCHSTLIEGKSEEAHTEEDSLAVPPISSRIPIPPTITRPAPVTADPARVDQLVDMGFSMLAAGRALVRARNNVAAATDMLLSMPHVFEEPSATNDASVAAPPASIAEEVASSDSNAPSSSATAVPENEGNSVPEAENHDMEVDSDSSDSDREALHKLREDYRKDLPARALTLLDHAEDLVFDLLPCFPSGEEGVKYLVNRLAEFSSPYNPTSDKAIAARLRLIAVCLRTADGILLKEDSISTAVKILSELPLNQSNPKPKWIPALLLFAETVAASSFTINNVKIGDDNTMDISSPSSAFASIAPRLAATCVEIVGHEETERNELVSALRLLVLMTREKSYVAIENTDLVNLLKPFKQPSAKLASCHPLLLLILRHAFEDASTLTAVIRKELRHWLTPARNKVVDIQHFIKQLRQAALRDPNCFVRVVEEECALVDPTPPQSVYHIRAKDQPEDASNPTSAQPSDPFQDDSDHARHPFVDHLVAELGQAVQTSLNESLDDSSDEVKQAHSYAGLLISILTELLGSYTPVKQYFVASVREQGLGTTRLHRGIASLINDLVCCVALQPDVTGIPQFERGSKPARRLAISSWAVSMILALCSDTTPSATVKAVPEDMANIRKTVLDAIVKVLRDSGSSSDLSVRYGRLWAIGELIYRLLMARPIGPTRQMNDSTLHIAKTMLEKNFVGLLTSALGEIDLNYPNVRNVLVSLLKTLDHLSKTSVKWGRVNKGDKDAPAGAPVTEESSSSDSDSESGSDIDMMEEEHDAPDLYRNSALGMLNGELGDEDDDQDDEDGDEDDMDMGDDITDDDEGTDLQTSEDESMGSELDPDNWTDEMEGEDEGDGDEQEMDQEVILGSNEDEEGEVWDDVPDDEDSLGTEENEMMEDEDDMDGVGEGDFDGDEIDMIEPFPSSARGGSMHRQSSDVTGPWAWDQSNFAAIAPSRGRSPLTRDAEDPAVSLFGRPAPQTNGQVAPHPLIIDPSSSAPPMRGLSRSLGSNYNDLISAIEGMGGTEAVQMLESLITSRQLAGSEAIRIDFAQDHNGTIGLSVGGRTFALHPPQNRQAQSNEADVVAEFVPVPTMQRWQEDMQLATSARNELTSRLVVHVINHLMPEARRRSEEETAKQKVLEEEGTRAQAEERKMDLASAASVTLPESRQPSPEMNIEADLAHAIVDGDNDSAPATAEPVLVEPAPVEPGSESLARTVISIHGQDVDITDTGIDLEFLQALPDDMRADVVEQHMREQNRQRRPMGSTNLPEAASQLNSEFLDALPPEIRAEVIMQEAMETARRNQPQPPSLSMNRAAGFLAGLTNELRDVMLLNQPTNLETLGIIPSSHAPVPATSTAKKPHREAIQLLEKPGIASLVRLLFFPETIKKGYLFKILVNLCENTSTRSDLLNLLLSVVQDGSGDLPAVDRSFQQMSLRGMVTPKATPRGKSIDSPAAAIVPNGLFSHLQTEHVPTFIAQRCFEALAYIVTANSAAVNYFLTEHEQPVGLKKHPLKKSKGKEKIMPQTKYPIVVLLGLLDRPLLAKTPGMMETVTSLLVTITKPLAEKKPDNKPESDATETPVPLQPIIPPAVLRLIVNCLTAGECTSRTFSSTLVAMQNLACLPDAKDHILQELRSRCKELGNTVHTQLSELTSALQDSSSEIGSLTLANFSPPTSDQAQLLRLLKTIDYLHLNKVDSDPPTKEMTDEERAVSAVFDSFDFESLWVQLGNCLSLVEARGSTDQIATVLLPLVEALMVVSKYRSRISREVRSPSAPPGSAIDADLFVSFTTTHRKVLNTIVRNNPSLLSGSFSLLIRNPRVLEFDNKRTWFFQKLKRKRDSHIPMGAIPLNIRRQYVFEDSFHALQRRTGDEIKYGKLSVKFYNEDGVDAGGVTREWYSVLAQQIFDPNFALFEPCAADQQTYQPNKASSVNGDHLAYFKFVGRVIGKAVYDGRLLDAYFNRAFYKQILGRTVDMRDLESIDPEYHKSLQWMLENDITGVIDVSFTIEDDQFGEKKIVELKPGGASVPVTQDNKEEYVRLVVSYRLDNSIKDQIKAFLEGFYDIIPRQIIQIFEPDQLELLISGITTVDVDELKNATQLSGWKTSDPEISWFWRALRSFSQEERSRFLMFVTSSSRVPLGGFTQLQGSSGTQPFQIQKLYAKEGSLPQASTCFNLLLLPTYASYEQLRDRLQFAIVETGGFGKA